LSKDNPSPQPYENWVWYKIRTPEGVVHQGIIASNLPWYMPLDHPQAKDVLAYQLRRPEIRDSMEILDYYNQTTIEP
jgi:hypothetical protein